MMAILGLVGHHSALFCHTREAQEHQTLHGILTSHILNSKETYPIDQQGPVGQPARRNPWAGGINKFAGAIGNDVFGHRTMKVSHPVRSAVNKHRIAWLVLQWVTMWESQVLNSL